MGKKSSRKKAAASQHTQLPSLVIITVDVDTEPKRQDTAAVETVRQLNVHPFEALLTGARNTGLAEGLQAGAQIQEELEVKLLKLEEHIKQLEQQVSSECQREATEAADSWVVRGKSGLEKGADTGRAELLLDLKQSKRHISMLKNWLCDEEERHEAEVTVARKEANVHRHEIGQRILANQQTRERQPLMRCI
jgi:hypothetical protein